MRIFIKAKPNARKNLVEKIDDRNFIISVKELPIQGRANRAILKELADYLGIPPYRLSIISGRASRQKIIEVVYPQP